MSWAIPLADDSLRDEHVDAVLDCLRSGWLTLGPRTEEFERAFAGRLGSGSAVAVASGSAALHLACRALSLGPGDEVIVHAPEKPAVAHALRRCGATPVPCAAGELLAAGVVEPLISARTRAVVAWHPWGYASDAPALRALCDRHGLALIEDARDALGALAAGGRAAGTIGHVGCFSCRAGRQLALGEGGVVVTSDPKTEARVRLLRSHAMTSGTWDRHRGHADAYDVVELGFNHRLDEPRAALGLARLAELEEAIAARRRLAAAYRERLDGLDGATPCFDADADRRASPLCFPVLARDRGARAALAAGLAASGIETAGSTSCPRALLLPLWPELSHASVDAVVAALTGALRGA